MAKLAHEKGKSGWNFYGVELWEIVVLNVVRVSDGRSVMKTYKYWTIARIERAYKAVNLNRKGKKHESR